MKITKLTSKRLLLEYPDIIEMNLASFRISEFSEGLTGIRNTYTTPDQLIEKYMDKNGNFNYMGYWEGHNFAAKEVRLFANAYIGEVSDREKAIINASKSIEEDGYIISMVKGDKITFKHEHSHMMYADTPLYKKRVDEILASIPKPILNRLKKGLLAINYIDAVLMDEIGAYLTSFDLKEFKELFPRLDPKTLKKQIKQLSDNYNQFNSKI